MCFLSLLDFDVAREEDLGFLIALNAREKDSVNHWVILFGFVGSK